MKTYQGDRSFTVYKHTNKANGNVNEAAKALKLNKGNISNACLGRRITCGGFIWSYENRGERIENL